MPPSHRHRSSRRRMLDRPVKQVTPSAEGESRSASYPYRRIHQRHGSRYRLRRWRANTIPHKFYIVQRLDGLSTGSTCTSVRFASRICTMISTRASLSRGLVKRTQIDKSAPEYCVMGTVIQEVKTSNIAREVLPSHANHCSRITRLCVST